MNEKEAKLSEFREVVLWQQLNKQLIELKSHVKPTIKKRHKFLQDFSFENQLFSRITKDPLISDMPLSLVSDLSGICFITFNVDSWTSILTQLIPNTIAFDIERALANTFEILNEYNKKYKLVDPETDDTDGFEDDKELLEFVETYLSLRESLVNNFKDIALILFEMKSDTLLKIADRHASANILKKKYNRLFLDYTGDSNRRDLIDIYDKTFLNRARLVIEPIISTISKDKIIDSLLHTEKKLKPSISKFIEHETAVLEKEFKLVQKFYWQLDFRREEYSQFFSKYTIEVCRIDPFSFIEYPLPSV